MEVLMLGVRKQWDGDVVFRIEEEVVYDLI